MAAAQQQGVNPAMVTSSLSHAMTMPSSLSAASQLLTTSAAASSSTATSVSSVNSALAALAARRAEERSSPQKLGASPLIKRSVNSG